MANIFGLAVNTHGCYGQGSWVSQGPGTNFCQDIISERSVATLHALVRQKSFDRGAAPRQAKVTLLCT